ncbi:ABC transporter ATP-binding protein [Aminobacter aminovorans]|uniref:ABC transporter ATP-binding protein n=1 Tax=Aminobacter aminovorans TaxID=83263 RepID=A0AAC8YJ11_AMIAI|nr:ABC transporter ATP-binding protein [Aminobacter aminovorans]AMS39237.1 ABC transporter ATP-binding protein [Aminobacter aminovorans]MBB3709217.1 multiple sugar transport system ATP-binding protein [Aminobacter aminovorans]
MTSVQVRDVSLSFGAYDVLKELNLDVPEGEFLVLLGPSGCGKSTLLNCIAGLLDVSEGQIFIKGKNVTWEEPKDRGIGMVFQSYALYPQMTVEGNLSFGLKTAGMARDEIARRVARASEILQIEPLLQRKPAALSGGQRQRVAIGRALVRDVDVFLFDEPLSNLDAKLRSELRVEIKRLHQKLANTMIYVTHDQIEAMTLADRIAVMKGGVIQQLDAPQVIYNKPVNRFVAGFLGSPGMNFLDGEVEGGDAPAFVAVGTKIPLGRYGFGGASKTGKAVFGVRPEHIVTGDAAAAMPFAADARVELVEPMGSDTLVWTKLGGQSLAFRVEAERHLATGDRLRIGFDPARASLFDGQSGNRM